VQEKLIRQYQKNVYLICHPLVQHKLTLLRDHRTNSRDFRQLLQEISGLMFYEVGRHIPTKTVQVTTPLGRATGKIIAGHNIALIPILRAGLAMVEGISLLVPQAKIGHIGLYRDPETLMPVEYFVKLPHLLPKRLTVLLDPMLATGHSAVAAVKILRQKNARKIILLCLLAAPEGIREFTRFYPNIPIYVAGVDRRLNSHGYILPGLGDAGDRIFGTK